MEVRSGSVGNEFPEMAVSAEVKDTGDGGQKRNSREVRWVDIKTSFFFLLGAGIPSHPYDHFSDG